MLEIRIHGRGGQGAVTTGQLIAIAAFLEGKYTQAFPMFGVERAGAPVQSFVRIDDKFINLRQQVYNPDMIIVLDASLFKTVDITTGLKKGGLVLINSNRDPKEFNLPKTFHIVCIDASGKAQSLIKKNIVNTPILGAFAKITGLVTPKSLAKAIEQRFKDKNIQDLNKKAINAVYKTTQ